MQTLHHDDNHPLLFIIEPRQERRFVPLVDALAFGFRRSVKRFERIIDDDNICPTASERSLDRRGEPKSAVGGDYLSLRILQARDLQSRKHRFVAG